MFTWAYYYAHLSAAALRTLIFLKMTVSGHMTIYLARTGHQPFYKRPWPAWSLILASECTQVVGTLCAVFGVFMHAISWRWAVVIWLYSIIEFLLNDGVKRAAYAVLRKLRGKKQMSISGAYHG